MPAQLFPYPPPMPRTTLHGILIPASFIIPVLFMAGFPRDQLGQASPGLREAGRLGPGDTRRATWLQSQGLQKCRRQIPLSVCLGWYKQAGTVSAAGTKEGSPVERRRGPGEQHSCRAWGESWRLWDVGGSLGEGSGAWGQRATKWRQEACMGGRGRVPPGLEG